MKYLVFMLVFFTLSCGNPFYKLVDDIETIFNYETSDVVYYEIDTLYGNVPIDIY